MKAISPTLLLIFILIITRVKQFGIKQLLLDDTSMLNLSLGLIGDLSISQAFIIKVSNILGTSASWSYKLLYVPALIPFVLVVVISIFIFNISSTNLKRICGFVA
nr:L-lactate permease [Vibrio alginolyticus]